MRSMRVLRWTVDAASAMEHEKPPGASASASPTIWSSRAYLGLASRSFLQRSLTVTRDTERSRLTLTRTNGSKVPASQQRSHGKVPVLIQRRCCANSVLRRVEVNVLPASSIPSAQGQAIWRRLRDGRFIARSRHMSRCFPPLHASNSRINGR